MEDVCRFRFEMKRNPFLGVGRHSLVFRGGGNSSSLPPGTLRSNFLLLKSAVSPIPSIKTIVNLEFQVGLKKAVSTMKKSTNSFHVIR